MSYLSLVIRFNLANFTGYLYCSQSQITLIIASGLLALAAGKPCGKTTINDLLFHSSYLLIEYFFCPVSRSSAQNT